MSAATAGTIVLGILGVAIVVSRTASLRRAAPAMQREREHAKNADGVLTGAESVVLEGTAERSALLLHGFNDTPQSLSELGRALHARGWTVHIPLLPQHGRGADTFLARGNADDWIAEARSMWRSTRKQSGQTILVGQSMGGALACMLAAEEMPTALVLLAPYLSMNGTARALARIWPLWQLFVPALRSNPERSLRDPAARARAIGGGRFSPRLVAELLRVVRRARRSLDQITAPTLVVHTRSDYRIPSLAAQQAYEHIGARDKTLIWSTRGGHVVAADEGREEVIANVLKWLDSRVVPRGAAAGTTLDAIRKD